MYLYNIKGSESKDFEIKIYLSNFKILSIMGASARAFLEMREIEAENENYESSKEVFQVCYRGQYSSFTIGTFYDYSVAKDFLKVAREMPKYRNYQIFIRS